MLTPASASHIRVTVKDDTLGLGARPKILDEPTGLDAFKGLLGRLNGKSDVELEKEQRKRDDIKLARYAATKWQAVRFVRGGLLVQEKTDAATTKLPENKSTDEKGNRTSNDVAIDGLDTSLSQNVTFSSRDLKNKDQEKKEKRKEKNEEKEKKDKKKKKRKENSQGDENDKSQRKRDKRAKKRKHSEDSEDLDSRTTTEDAVMTEANVAAETSSVVVPTSASRKERVPLGRNVTRARHIAQKKRALLDDKSLNEVTENLHIHLEGFNWLTGIQIFMVKS